MPGRPASGLLYLSPKVCVHRTLRPPILRAALASFFMGASIAILALASMASATACSRRTASHGCSSCHEGTHPGDAHVTIPCSSCHAGNAGSTLREEAHAGLVAIPGNLSNAATACAPCHAAQVDNMSRSLMTTNAGMIAVNRFAFGEAHSPDIEPSPSGPLYGNKPGPGGNTPASLSHSGLNPHTSAADSYFAQLCTSCHLGEDRAHTGPPQGYEKGGGCLACHLQHTPQPRLKKTPDANACFLCHSRSGRISLNYNGYAEIAEGEEGSTVHTLPDGRRLKSMPADVHRERGMKCTDCHASSDTMGDGHSHQHKEEAVRARCENCHTKRHPSDANHARLSCTSCHTSWAPNCFGCHIRYERTAQGTGQWIESEGETLYRPPVLGVTADGRVRPFVPGMKMTIDRSAFTAKPESPIHRVLFAPSFSHTVGKQARSCTSCHRDSSALGFGEGRLKKAATGWTFQPAYKTESGLPQDAWILPFKEQAESPPLTTRIGARPLNPAEQKRILNVGLCLNCHAPTADFYRNLSAAMQHRHRSPLP